LAAISLCLPAVMQFTGLSSDAKIVLNRPLATMPSLPRSLDGFERFRQGATNFVEDNFGLRTEMIRLNYYIHAWLGVSSSAAHLIGKDGWFFLKEDLGIFDQFRGANLFKDRELDDWIDNVDMYRVWLEKRGIAFEVVIAPNKQTIYPDYMPFYATRVWPETRIDQLIRRLRERRSSISLIELRAALWAARPIALLYRKYESHWNNLGGYFAYLAVMDHIKKLFPSVRPVQADDLKAINMKQHWFVPPMSETESILVMKDSARVVPGDILDTVDGRSIKRFRSHLKDSIDVLMYGDSFGETFLGLFSATSKTATFVPAASYPFPVELVKSTRPDLVILEVVERALVNPVRVSSEVETDVLTGRAPPYATAMAEIGKYGGAIDGVSLNGDGFRFNGWASDPASNAPATMIFAFDRDRLVAAARPSFDRPDVTAGMSNQRAGFVLPIPANVDVRQAGRELRFFSVTSTGKILELALYPPLRPKLEDLGGKK
jgi:hypothetical protein